MPEESRNAAFFAEAFGLTERHFRQLVADGVLLKLDRGHYPLIANIRRYVDELRRQIESNEEFVDLRKEQARKTRFEAELLEAKLAIQRKEHVHISVMRDLLERFASRLEDEDVSPVDRDPTTGLAFELDLGLLGQHDSGK